MIYLHILYMFILSTSLLYLSLMYLVDPSRQLPCWERASHLAPVFCDFCDVLCCIFCAGIWGGILNLIVLSLCILFQLSSCYTFKSSYKVKKNIPYDCITVQQKFTSYLNTFGIFKSFNP